MASRKFNKSELEKLSKDDLILLLLKMNGDDQKVRFIEGYRKQIKNAADYFELNNVIEDLQNPLLENAAKFMIDKSPSMLDNLATMEVDILPIAKENQAFIEESEVNGLAHIIKLRNSTKADT